MSGRYHWYSFILLALAGAIVYPDTVLRWAGEQRGRPFARWQVVLFVPIASGAMALVVCLLRPICPALDWWDPVIFVGAVGAVRFIYWFSESFIRGLFDV